MIYDIEEKGRIMHTEVKKHDRAADFSTTFWQKVIILIQLPQIICAIFKGLFMMLRYFLKVRSNIDEYMEKVEAKAERKEMVYHYNNNRIRVRHEYIVDTQTLSVQMNRDALVKFSSELKEMFKEVSITIHTPVDGKFTPSNVGYHTHSEFFFPELEHEITVGTIQDKLFDITSGDTLYASPERWMAYHRILEEVIEANVPKLIVLDQNQAEWCSPKSTGRFMIEYAP